MDDVTFENKMNALADAIEVFGVKAESAAQSFVKMLSNSRFMEWYAIHCMTPYYLSRYISEQPNHTFNGVTIYPDEVWRFSSSNEWIWWKRGE